MKRILFLLIACLFIGTTVNAKNSMSTEVQIAIEASEIQEEKASGVQTGDDKQSWGYVLAIGVAVLVGVFSLARKRRKTFVAVWLLFLSLFFASNSACAAESTENVSVTIPSSISVIFENTGENSISDFSVLNESMVPISINKINVAECNGWRLCRSKESIPVDTKQMSFIFDGRCLEAGENAFDRVIKEESSTSYNIKIYRGAWTTSASSEAAIQMEFEYSIGKKEFQLNFDANGGTPVASQMICNGDEITLPSTEREGYELAGWEDSDGKLFTDKFVMPIGDMTLTARWKEKKPYAIYIEEDTSLRFIQSADEVVPGGSYKGMTITNVFTGFDTERYTSVKQVPWNDGKGYNVRHINKVIVEDTIQPVSIAYWFYELHEVEYIDVSKLDTSKVNDMSYAFYIFARSSTKVTFIGLDKWNTSNVTNMKRMFGYAAVNASRVVLDISGWDVSNVTDMYRMFTEFGYNASTFGLGDLSKWDVSNVTDMYEMFINAGYKAEWYMDLSGWDVSKVTRHDYFDSGIDRKIGDPQWAR